MPINSSPRRKAMITVSLVIAFSITLASCTKQESGTLLGAIGGAVVGSAIGGKGGGTGKVIAVAAGTLAGAYIGSEIGKSLDRADRQAMREKTQYSLENTPSGEATTWYNPDSGNSGTITPQPAYSNKADEYCREYQQTVTVAGKTETAYGTACRQEDGTWKIINQ
ncbi:MAG: glycine zipper 2TM domain-containing protein [Emcibacter sp.]|nr:glycine zipper 2TM domain-containing protein [Emcibacter sp.]